MAGKKTLVSDDAVLAGAGLRIRREQLGRSVEDVASRIKKNRSTVTRWEAGVNLDQQRVQIRRAYGYYSERMVALAVHDAYDLCADHELVFADSLKAAFRRTARGRRGSNNLMLAEQAVHRAAMEPMLLTLPPGENTGDKPEGHWGEEFLYVIEGVLHIEFIGPVRAQSVKLEQGAFAHFRSDLPHRLRNDGREQRVTVLVIKHPPDRYSRHSLEETASRIRQAKAPRRSASRGKTSTGRTHRS